MDGLNGSKPSSFTIYKNESYKCVAFCNSLLMFLLTVASTPLFNTLQLSVVIPDTYTQSFTDVEYCLTSN